MASRTGSVIPVSSRSLMGDRETLRRWILTADEGIVSPYQGMRQVTVWACVTLIADSVSQLPLRLYRRRPDDTRVEERNHPLARLVRTPTTDFSAFTFRNTMAMHLASAGNAYAIILRDRSNVPLELVLIPPLNVSPRQDPSDPYLVHTEDGTRTVEPQNMLHVMRYTHDGTTGVSPIMWHSKSIEAAENQAGYVRSYFKGGAKISGVLQHPGTLKEDKVEQLRERFSKIYATGGAGEAGTAVLTNGMEFKAVSPISPADAAYVESKRLSSSEIAGQIFRVPPILIGMTEATYDRSQQLKLFFLQTTLNPYLTAIESEMRRKLITTRERDNLFFDHDETAFLRTTTKERFESYRLATGGAAVITPNEARALENLPPKDGNDELAQPLNTTLGDEPVEPQEGRQPDEERVWSLESNAWVSRGR